MRELELHPSDERAQPRPEPQTVAVIGAGRLGRALVRALREQQVDVSGPLGRGSDGEGRDAVLLCVPDASIEEAARAVTPGALVGHCSGAHGLDLLAPHEAFSMHPLMTFTDSDAVDLTGAGAAVAGSTVRALSFARQLARQLGLEPVEVAAADRAAYHAAASIASNFLVTLEASAERVGAGTGLERRLLAPLVLATVENWARLGPDALTGPVRRGDWETVERQRRAVRERAPDLAPLFDALTDATRRLAAVPEPEPA